MTYKDSRIRGDVELGGVTNWKKGGLGRSVKLKGVV